ncbi:EamA family transporter [Nocardioides sp. AX2bis]|uniref:EamA family transporter n=1 Tax=Nocardioides sp. AX2bis TaxID=2653157 RepID=UPI0012F313F0|nr:EamA family transporter [Nocardioides sp. AX2bis]VXB37948.1 conserved membrane hypothetical protein [Nocardioides sp. AX2bis]
MTALGLALVAALTYGLSDFVGGVASHRASAWAVALLSQLGGAGAVLVVALVVGGTPEPADWAWAVLGGVGNGVGTAFLYRGLSSGRMGVVAPLSGVGAAVVPVAAGLALGERPRLMVAAGLVVAAPAIWLVSREPADDPAPVPRRGGGRTPARAAVVDGLLAGAGFGTLFAALAQVGDDAGLFPVLLNQLVAAVVVVVVAAGLRAPWVPRRPAAYLGLVSGVLGVTGTLLFLLSARAGYLAVAGVLTSLYPAVTVLLAALLLRERVHRSQGVGLLLCAAAVTLVALG